VRQLLWGACVFACIFYHQCYVFPVTLVVKKADGDVPEFRQREPSVAFVSWGFHSSMSFASKSCQMCVFRQRENVPGLTERCRAAIRVREAYQRHEKIIWLFRKNRGQFLCIGGVDHRLIFRECRLYSPEDHRILKAWGLRWYITPWEYRLYLPSCDNKRGIIFSLSYLSPLSCPCLSLQFTWYCLLNVGNMRVWEKIPT